LALQQHREAEYIAMMPTSPQLIWKSHLLCSVAILLCFLLTASGKVWATCADIHSSRLASDVLWILLLESTSSLGNAVQMLLFMLAAVAAPDPKVTFAGGVMFAPACLPAAAVTDVLPAAAGCGE